MRSIVALVALSCGVAAADTPVIDTGAPAPATREPVAEEPARPWRLLLASMLGMRGGQGSLIDGGYRFNALVGVIAGPISVSLTVDQQLGEDNRIRGTESDPATFSESIASVRIGHRFGLGPDFWITGELGAARVHTRVTRLASMNNVEQSTLGFDAVATVVWRSGRIASTVVLGATVIPTDEEFLIESVRLRARQRVEPWFGLGVALLLF